MVSSRSYLRLLERIVKNFTLLSILHSQPVRPAALTMEANGPKSVLDLLHGRRTCPPAFPGLSLSGSSFCSFERLDLLPNRHGPRHNMLITNSRSIGGGGMKLAIGSAPVLRQCRLSYLFGYLKLSSRLATLIPVFQWTCYDSLGCAVSK